MPASTTKALQCCCHTTNSRFMRVEFTNQWSSLTVSRSPQQPLHRLSHVANHASSTMFASSRRSWPTETCPTLLDVCQKTRHHQTMSREGGRYHLPLCGCSPHRRASMGRRHKATSTTPSIPKSQPCTPKTQKGHLTEAPDEALY